MSDVAHVPRLVIAGGTGFIGTAIRKLFEAEGYEVVVLSRSRKMQKEFKTSVWDGENLGEWAGFLDGAVAVINLAGEPATLLWTEENKKKILDSRTKSTAVIGKAIRACSSPPKVWINASGVGYYGDCGDRELDESSPAGEGFLAETCLLWERAQEESETPATRKVRIRIGAALGRDGGAYVELAKVTKRFLGGAQGSGNQWMSWIHVEDLAKLFHWAVESDHQGAVNGVGPEPVRNKELMAALRRSLNRPWSPPAPAFAVKIVARLMGKQVDPVLDSQRAKSSVLVKSGFQYNFPALESALRDLAKE